MRQPDYSGQFKRDVKLAQKRGKDMGQLTWMLHKFSVPALPR